MRDKKGFTLLELLICLTVVSTLSVLALSYYRPVSFDAEQFVLYALSLKTKAMLHRETQTKKIGKIEAEYNLYGHPAYSNTYHFHHNDVIVHIGWGKISVR